MTERFDLAVVGSGFAGSLMAMIAQRLELRVILLERGRHPRMVIGESSTPLSNLLLEELARRYDLASIRSLSKWGTWRNAHPELACGLKRGFSFFHHSGAAEQIARNDQLLVAASPYDAIADTHWYRAESDSYLAGAAERAGVVYFDEVEISTVREDQDEIRLLGTRSGQPIEIAAGFVVDASGPRGLLHRMLRLGEIEVPQMPATSALYNHFSGVRRLIETDGVVLDGRPPYPIDDAAVHHIFDGGWVWVLHFSNGITSAGLAATDQLAQELRLIEGEPAWRRVLQRFPVLLTQFGEAKPMQPFRHVPELKFRSARVVGRNWALLPSAAGFIDPLLSTGFPLTLMGVMRLANILERHCNPDELANRLEQYSKDTHAELMAVARLIGALYANFNNFPVFSALSLLYFAAASYAETSRRLGKPELASSFLLHDHPTFGPQCARLLERARLERCQGDREELIGEILEVIAPIDVAGLTDRTRDGWYGVDARDLLDAAHKVSASRDEISQMLERCGFNTVPSSQA